MLLDLPHRVAPGDTCGYLSFYEHRPLTTLLWALEPSTLTITDTIPEHFLIMQGKEAGRTAAGDMSADKRLLPT